MAISLVVEGDSDLGALPVILRNANIAVASNPIQFGGQPVQCSVSILVERILLPKVRIATLRSASRVLVVLDREARPDCPGDFANEVERELVEHLVRQGYNHQPPITVICVDRCLENWLLADPAGLAKHAYISRSPASKVGNNADGVHDAQAVIRWAYRKGSQYHKRRDAPGLAAKIRVLRPEVRKRSKSLDKFLREAGVPRSR